MTNTIEIIIQKIMEATTKIKEANAEILDIDTNKKYQLTKLTFEGQKMLRTMKDNHKKNIEQYENEINILKSILK